MRPPPGEEFNSTQSPRGVPEKEVLNLAKYMLSTDIPSELKSRFERLCLLFDRDYALANIQRRDMPYFDVTFQFVTELIAAGMYDYATEVMVQLIQDLKLSRSIDALQLRLGVSGTQRTETISKYGEQERKKSFIKKIGGAFIKNKDMDNQEEF